MLLCIIPFLFEFAINFQSIWVNIESMIVGLHCLALENIAHIYTLELDTEKLEGI